MSVAPISVANMAFLFERVARDCGPLQFVRELTVNGIEATTAHLDKPEAEVGYAPEVRWDTVDWPLPGGGTARKLACIDNGTGMTGDEMVYYVNQLAASGRVQGHDQNFGVGAKISTAVRNPHGVLYLSWVDGVGAMVMLCCEDDGEWGLHRWQTEDGMFEWVDAFEDLKPDLIGQHGTMVVLLGHSDDEDTTVAPDGVNAASAWVARALNDRFFTFDPRVTVRAREFDARGDMRTVTGQREHLDRRAELSGRHDVPGATVHWWVLPEPGKADAGSRHRRGGHAGVLYRGELYELTPNPRASRTTLLNYGVFFAQNRVVVYAEPQPSETQPLESNFGRTALLCNGGPLPLADWQASFATDQPPALAGWLEQMGDSDSRSSSRTVQEKLEKFLPTLGGLRLRQHARGRHAGSPGGLPTGGGADGAGPAGDGGGAAGPDGEARRPATGVPLLARRAGRARGVPAGPQFPQVQWVSTANGTREDGFLDGRVGHYVMSTNTLLLNADFALIATLAEKYAEPYEGRVGPQLVATVVRSEIEILVVQRVLALRGLAGDAHWTEADVQRGLSEESLTAAAIDGYWLHFGVSRELGTRFGSTKQPA